MNPPCGIPRGIQSRPKIIVWLPVRRKRRGNCKACR